MPNQLLIGTAGWAVPRELDSEHSGEGSHLERYARRFLATEINSSFHRPHRLSTYERWAGSVPDGFRFSVKLPREITHAAKLVGVEDSLDSFLSGVAGLGEKLGCLLVQLPPKLAFDATAADSFFASLRNRYEGALACEPRHPSWLEPTADDLLYARGVARVAADPDRPPGAAEPGGWPDLRYYRLHGSPRLYYSRYTPEDLERWAGRITRHRRDGGTVWCILDNTASGAAAGNALDLIARTAG